VPLAPFDPGWACSYEGNTWGAVWELAMASLSIIFAELAALFMLGVFWWDWYQAENGC
jgi:hypothetical protein